MTFKDDPQTKISGQTFTVNDSYDVISVRFQMRKTEFDLIKGGLKADLVDFVEWLEPDETD
tara:strand:- start:671 stop:853 length:183 start_codon:yes stop_codon:yes gene_type:complete